MELNNCVSKEKDLMDCVVVGSSQEDKKVSPLMAPSPVERTCTVATSTSICSKKEVHSNGSIRSSKASDSKRKFVVELSPNDVLFGRGSPVIQYEGNKRFRELVALKRSEYLSCERGFDKNIIAAQIIQEITKNRKGRFLKRASPRDAEKLDFPAGTKIWYVAENSVIMEKTKQALREKDPKISIDSSATASSNDGSRSDIDPEAPTIRSASPSTSFEGDLQHLQTRSLPVYNGRHHSLNYDFLSNVELPLSSVSRNFENSGVRPSILQLSNSQQRLRTLDAPNSVGLPLQSFSDQFELSDVSPSILTTGNEQQNLFTLGALNGAGLPSQSFSGQIGQNVRSNSIASAIPNNSITPGLEEISPMLPTVLEGNLNHEDRQLAMALLIYQKERIRAQRLLLEHISMLQRQQEEQAKIVLAQQHREDDEA